MVVAKKHNVLIVDDVPINIKILATMLKDEYQIIMATNGRDALEIVDLQDVALILLDVVMPEMDGYEVCKRLKSNQRTSKIPVFFISEVAEYKDQIKGLPYGAVGYIKKPFNSHEVIAKIKEHLTT